MQVSRPPFSEKCPWVSKQLCQPTTSLTTETLERLPREHGLGNHSKPSRQAGAGCLRPPFSNLGFKAQALNIEEHRRGSTSPAGARRRHVVETTTRQISLDMKRHGNLPPQALRGFDLAQKSAGLRLAR